LASSAAPAAAAAEEEGPKLPRSSNESSPPCPEAAAEGVRLAVSLPAARSSSDLPKQTY
jgi:hypothetical protein